MIELTSLTEKDIGRKVLYNKGIYNPIEGTITSFSEYFIFVKFRGPNGEACRPKDLTFKEGEENVKI